MITLEKPKLLILKNEDPYDHLGWINACEKFKDKIDYEIVDLTLENWLDEVINKSPDYLLLKPSGKTSLFRYLYEERLDILVNDLQYKTYPSFKEVRIYENKRFFAYWAKANRIPHPKTYVFYNRMEIHKNFRSLKFPIVGKMNVGASGKGVEIINNLTELKCYLNKAFGKGLISVTGPKLQKGKLIERLKILSNPKMIINRLKTYRDISLDRQTGFVILQEYIPHEFEWRVVRIGNSFFAHKKVKQGEKASGSLIKDYTNPPASVLNFVKHYTDLFDFNSVAFDIFEVESNLFLINEIQCIFGQSDSYQMLVNGVPGRYIHNAGIWIFEKGDFAINGCYNLRLEYLISNCLGLKY